jgi:hypothetical protein
MDNARAIVEENHERPRLVRFDEPQSFIKNGEAYVWFATRGDKLPEVANLPFSVTVQHKAD